MNAANTELPGDYFVVGGTLRHDALSYVERGADQELFRALMRGEFCYVLTARQMGKSSLMIRTAARLRGEGIGVAVLDLTAIGQNLNVEQWYAGLLVQTGQRLGLEEELIEFWLAQPLLGPLQRWIKALRTIVLPRRPGRLVIFIDEIDAVRSLPFSTDELFAGIRECYNQRGEDPAMECLAFCLSGVATPSDLIRDVRTTPFNIGRRIELNDFTETESLSLARGLDCEEKTATMLLKRIHYWAGGHPYLTQRLCQAVAETLPQSDDADFQSVDRLCEELFFSRRAQNRDDNLLFVRERMLNSETDVAGLLELYDRVLKRRAMPDDLVAPRMSVLRLSGITRAEAGRLKVRNRIYERVFDRTWVATNMPDAEVRRQRAAYRRGIWRTSAIAVFILALVGWLAFTAVRQRNRFEQQVAANRRLLYFAQMKLAQQEWEAANVDRVEELLDLQIPQPGEADLRGFEWRLFQRLTHQDIFRFRESRQIAGVALLPGDAALLIGQAVRTERGSDEYLLKRYDLNSRREASSFTVPAGRNFDLVVFSPDKRFVAADGAEKNIALWEVDSGRLVADFRGHRKAITAIAFSPDGTRLATGDFDGVVKLWDTATGKETLSLTQLNRWIKWATFSHDGRLLATTDESPVLKLWDAATGREVRSIAIADTSLIRAAFFPNAERLAERLVVTSKDGRLHMVDVQSGRTIATLTRHTREAAALVFSPDGKMLATGAVDRTVKLWDAATGRELATIRGHGSAVSSLAWATDGKRLVTGSLDGAVKIWEVAASREIIPPEAPVTKYFATAFLPNRQVLALGVAGTPVSQVKLWNVSTGQEVTGFRENGDILYCAAFSPDGKLLATGGKDHNVKLWDVATGNLIHLLTNHRANVYSVDFSPDGSLLISGSEDRTLRLWEVSSGRELALLLNNEVDNYYRAVFSPDGQTLAAACRDGSVKLWDVATRSVIRTFTGHYDKVRAIAFSRDGRRLATGGKDNTIRLWDVLTGRELKRLGRSDYVQRAAFSPHELRLVTGGVDGSVKLWDLDTQQEMILPGHAGEVSSVAFSVNGLDLATCGTDGVVRLWRAAPVFPQ